MAVGACVATIAVGLFFSAFSCAHVVTEFTVTLVNLTHSVGLVAKGIGTPLRHHGILAHGRAVVIILALCDGLIVTCVATYDCAPVTGNFKWTVDVEA